MGAVGACRLQHAAVLLQAGPDASTRARAETARGREAGSQARSPTSKRQDFPMRSVPSLPLPHCSRPSAGQGGVQSRQISLTSRVVAPSADH